MGKIKDPKDLSFRKITLPEIYNSQYYSGTLDFKTYKNICSKFNISVMDRIIKFGEVFNLGFGLSRIAITKVIRDYSRQTIDWVKSKKRKQKLIDEGKDISKVEWFVYDLSPFFTTFWWDKYHCKIPNSEFYTFYPSRGACGNTQILKKHLEDNPEAHVNYLQLEHTNDKYTYLGTSRYYKNIQRSKSKG